MAQFHEDILQIKGNFLVPLREIYDITILIMDNNIEYKLVFYDIECSEAPIVIVGNKCDMEAQREVPTEVGRKYAEKFGIPFFETSAKQRINVEEAFLEVVRQIIRYNPEKTKRKYKRESRKFLCTLM